MIAACMPTLRPLKRTIFKDMSFTSLITSSVERLTSLKPFGRTSRTSASQSGFTGASDTELKRVISTPQEHEYNTSSAATPKQSRDNGSVRVEHYHIRVPKGDDEARMV
jgi:hypothetical protein